MMQADRSLLLRRDLCRAARGLLDWTQAQLAERADVSRSTIRDFEGGLHELHRSTALRIQATFESEGVVFLALADAEVALYRRHRPRCGGTDARAPVPGGDAAREKG